MVCEETRSTPIGKHNVQEIDRGGKITKASLENKVRKKEERNGKGFQIGWAIRFGHVVKVMQPHSRDENFR